MNKLLNARKRSLKVVLKDGIDIKEHLLHTNDYSFKDIMLKSIQNFSIPPLWDWFTLTNKKHNHLYYISFSCPFYSVNYDRNILASMCALHDSFALSFKPLFIFKKGYSIIELNPEEMKYREKRKQWYLDHLKMDLINQDLREWKNKNTLVNRILVAQNSKDKYDLNVIVPFTYNQSIAQVFEEVIEIFFNGKRKNHLISWKESENYLEDFTGKLIENRANYV